MRYLSIEMIYEKIYSQGNAKKLLLIFFLIVVCMKILPQYEEDAMQARLTAPTYIPSILFIKSDSDGILSQNKVGVEAFYEQLYFFQSNATECHLDVSTFGTPAYSVVGFLETFDLNHLPAEWPIPYFSVRIWENAYMEIRTWYHYNGKIETTNLLLQIDPGENHPEEIIIVLDGYWKDWALCAAESQTEKTQYRYFEQITFSSIVSCI